MRRGMLALAAIAASCLLHTAPAAASKVCGYRVASSTGLLCPYGKHQVLCLPHTTALGNCDSDLRCIGGAGFFCNLTLTSAGEPRATCPPSSRRPAGVRCVVQTVLPSFRTPTPTIPGELPTDTPTATPVPPTPTGTDTATVGADTPTPEATVTASATETPEATSTGTAVSTATATPVATATDTVVATATVTATGAATATVTVAPTSTETGAPTATATSVATATGVATATTTAAATATNTGAATATTTPVSTATSTAVATATNTGAATATATSAATSTNTVAPATSTSTPVATSTATATVPAATSTATPIATSTNTAVATDTSTPMATATTGPPPEHKCVLDTAPTTDSQIQIHIAALPVPLTFGISGALDLGGSGTTSSCDIQTLNPVNIPSIGFVCISASSGCEPGVRHCGPGDGPPLGVDVQSDGDAGACTSNAHCADTATTACAPDAVLNSACTGFCSGPVAEACTNDSDCLGNDSCTGSGTPVACCTGPGTGSCGVANGACNGPDPIQPSQRNICQITCIDTAAHGPSEPGDVQCNLGSDLVVETGAPCNGTDVLIDVGSTCIPVSTQRATSLITDANFTPGALLPNPPNVNDLSGNGVACDTFDSSTVTGLIGVGAVNFFGSALGDLAVGIKATCQ